MKLLIMVGLVFLLPSTTAVAQAPVAQQPVWTIGDTWTYKGVDGKKFTVMVTGISDDHWSLMTKGENQQEHVALLKFDFSPNSFARFNWPLEVKKQWTFSFNAHANNGGGGTENTYITTSTVEAFESVTVPAGTFDAFRVHGRQCNSSQNNRCGEFSVWYAPQVKNYVKEQFFTPGWWSYSGKTTELLEYHVQ